jgi:hypothetical protein
MLTTEIGRRDLEAVATNQALYDEKVGAQRVAWKKKISIRLA